MGAHGVHMDLGLSTCACVTLGAHEYVHTWFHVWLWAWVRAYVYMYPLGPVRGSAHVLRCVYLWAWILVSVHVSPWGPTYGICVCMCGRVQGWVCSFTSTYTWLGL